MIIDSPRRREHLAAIAARMPAHVERLSWTAEQIRAERQRALRETLLHAKANSPWHANRLSRVDPAAFTEADLQALPVMTKTDVMTHWDAIVTDRRLTLAGCNAHIAAKLNGTCKDYYYLDEYLVIATGGSSGVRGVFPWGWNEFIEIVLRDVPLSGARRAAGDIDRPAPARGDRGRRDRSWQPLPLLHSDRSGAPVKWFPASTPIAELVSELNDAQPTQINSFASSLQEIAAEALAGRLKISPHRVTANSEPLMPETRDAARKAWDVEINNMWGCVEVGHIGIECDMHEGLHRSDDLIITEFVDHNDRPTTDPDAIDRILVTSLFGRTMPLIRYELTDVPIPERPALLLRRGVSADQGREGALGRYFHLSGRCPHTPLGVPDAAWTQQRDRAISGAPDRARGEDRRHCHGSHRYRRAYERARRRLAKAGLADAEIEIDLVDTLERHKETGKLRRFIPLAKS